MDFITLLAPLAVYLATELIRKYSSWIKSNGAITITLIVPFLSAGTAYLSQIINPSIGFWEQTAYGLLAVFVNELIKQTKTTITPLSLIIMLPLLFNCSGNEVIKQQELTVIPEVINKDMPAIDFGQYIQGLQTRDIVVNNFDGKKKAQSTPLLMCAIIQLKSELQLKQNRTQYELPWRIQLGRQSKQFRKFPGGKNSDICFSGAYSLLYS